MPQDPASALYINAVRVRNYSMQEAFIVTEHPMINTISRAWKLAYKTRASAWVFLHEHRHQMKVGAELPFSQTHVIVMGICVIFLLIGLYGLKYHTLSERYLIKHTVSTLLTLWNYQTSNIFAHLKVLFYLYFLLLKLYIKDVSDIRICIRGTSA